MGGEICLFTALSSVLSEKRTRLCSAKSSYPVEMIQML
jgi:hypothetical protein